MTWQFKTDASLKQRIQMFKVRMMQVQSEDFFFNFESQIDNKNKFLR